MKTTLVVILLISFAFLSDAEEKEWIGGDWGNSTSWNPVGTPITQDDVIITFTDLLSYLTIDIPIQVNSLTVNGAGTIDIQQPISVLTNITHSHSNQNQNASWNVNAQIHTPRFQVEGIAIEFPGTSSIHNVTAFHLLNGTVKFHVATNIDTVLMEYGSIVFGSASTIGSFFAPASGQSITILDRLTITQSIVLPDMEIQGPGYLELFSGTFYITNLKLYNVGVLNFADLVFTDMFQYQSVNATFVNFGTVNISTALYWDFVSIDNRNAIAVTDSVTVEICNLKNNGTFQAVEGAELHLCGNGYYSGTFNIPSIVLTSGSHRFSNDLSIDQVQQILIEGGAAQFDLDTNMVRVASGTAHFTTANAVVQDLTVESGDVSFAGSACINHLTLMNGTLQVTSTLKIVSEFFWSTATRSIVNGSTLLLSPSSQMIVSANSMTEAILAIDIDNYGQFVVIAPSMFTGQQFRNHAPNGFIAILAPTTANFANIHNNGIIYLNNTVDLVDATLTNSRTMVIENGALTTAEYHQFLGQLQLQSSIVQAQEFNLLGGKINGSGVISANVNHYDGKIFVQGVNLNITGTYTQHNATAGVDLMEGQFLQVTGNVELAGHLTLRTNQAGSSWTALQTSGTISGAFSAIFTPYLAANISLLNANKSLEILVLNEQPSFSCSASTCVKGYCVAQDTCTCTAGYTGSDCSTPICSGCTGSCVAPNRCICNSGYVGIDCNTTIDECSLAQYNDTIQITFSEPDYSVNDFPVSSNEATTSGSITTGGSTTSVSTTGDVSNATTGVVTTGFYFNSTDLADIFASSGEQNEAVIGFGITAGIGAGVFIGVLVVWFIVDRRKKNRASGTSDVEMTPFRSDILPEAPESLTEPQKPSV